MIEFAICMPILIILLFYIHDLVKIKRYYSQTEFVAQQMANILQNISQKRTNKAITLNDIRYAFALAWQTLYSGKSMYWVNSGHELVHCPIMHIYCVKGTGNGKASCLWRTLTHVNNSVAKSPLTLRCESAQSDHSGSSISYGTDVLATSIHPNLKIDTDELKIIIEPMLHYATTFKDNEGKTKTPLKKALGLYLAKPKYIYNNYYYPFGSIVIFTPKSGLFSETAPS